MKTKSNDTFEILKSDFESNKSIRVAIYVISILVVIFLAGKVFSMFAGSIRGYNDFRSAVNGN